MRPQYDITGKQFGYWTVIRKDDKRPKSHNTLWICRCKCGTVRSVLRWTLVDGSSQSCGCKPSENLKGINSTHGLSKTRIYHEWCSMRKRCKAHSQKDAKTYLLRGIRVCDEWDNDFMTFYDWAMNNGYSDELTIDRIDNDLGYGPDNCRWVTIEEQQRNKTDTLRIEYSGKEWCLRTLCTKLGIPYDRAYRIYKKAKQNGTAITINDLIAPSYNGKRMPKGDVTGPADFGTYMDDYREL